MGLYIIHRQTILYNDPLALDMFYGESVEKPRSARRM